MPTFCKLTKPTGHKNYYCAKCGIYSVIDEPRECQSIEQRRLETYLTAIERWTQAGKPERTDEEVTAIYEQHCTPCPLFKHGHCQHKNCGCSVLTVQEESATLFRRLTSWLLSPAMVNKLRMGTEHCPIGKW